METIETSHPGARRGAVPVRRQDRPWVDQWSTAALIPSSYVERFWLGTLGPTATWLVRRLAPRFDDQPDGYELDLATTAQALGLSYSRGHRTPSPRHSGGA